MKDIKRAFKIASWGSYLPKRKVMAEELEKELDTPQGYILEKTKIQYRHHADNTETNSIMGANALHQALQKANLKAKDLDLIINASASKEQVMPYQAALIQQELISLTGDKTINTPCMDVDTSCLSFVSALEMATHMLETGAYKRIAIVSSEVASCGLNKKHFESYTLFGDGAAAFIFERDDERKSGLVSFNLRTFSKGAKTCEILAGGTKFNVVKPPAKIEDYMFKMDGKGAFRLSAEKLPEFLDEFFEKSGIKGFEDIDVVVPHQASPLALEHMIKRLELSLDKMVYILHKRGNQVAASIPFSLIEALDTGMLKKGQSAMLFGTSAGLSIGALLFRL